MEDITIVGAGLTGLFATKILLDSNIRPTVVEMESVYGGVLRYLDKTEILDPSGKKFYGEEYLRFLSESTAEARFIFNSTALKLDDKKVFVVSKKGVNSISGKTIIVAVGGRELNEFDLRIYGFRPAGIFTAFTAIQLMKEFKRRIGRRIVLYGNKEYLLDVAILAKKLNSEIVLLCSPSSIDKNMRELSDMANDTLENSKVLWVEGEGRLSRIVIDAEGNEKTVEADTLIIGMGLTPEPILLWRSGTQIDISKRTPILDNNNRTTLENVYVIGYAAKPYNSFSEALVETKKTIEHILRERRE